MFLLFEVFGNLRLRKQVYHPEDAFWSLHQLLGAPGSLQAVLRTKKKHLQLIVMSFCCLKSVKYLYENSGRLISERILVEDFLGEF